MQYHVVHGLRRPPLRAVGAVQPVNTPSVPIPLRPARDLQRRYGRAEVRAFCRATWCEAQEHFPERLATSRLLMSAILHLDRIPQAGRGASRLPQLRARSSKSVSRAQQVRLSMRRRDLRANSGLALRHDWIREGYHVDSLLKQAFC